MDTRNYPAEIEEHLANLKLLAENSPDHIIVTDPEGIIVYANPAVSKITGFTNEEVIGSKAGKLWGGLMPKEYYKKLWSTIKVEKKDYIGEIQNRSKSGEIYRAEVAIVPIMDENKNIYYFLGNERKIEE